MQKKALVNKGMKGMRTNFLSGSPKPTHRHSHTPLLWHWVNGHRDKVFPAGLCRWGLSALFSPEGLGLSFCSGMAEFNWRTLMRSWIAELLTPWLALKMGGCQSRAGVCVCVSPVASADIPQGANKCIHRIQAVCYEPSHLQNNRQ